MGSTDRRLSTPRPGAAPVDPPRPHTTACHRRVGSLSSKAPSSYSIMAATDVTGLVMDASRQMVSTSTGKDCSRSRIP